MVAPNEHHPQPSVRILAGALAHLSHYMENGCPRSAYLAVTLLEQIAGTPETDVHLRCYAQQLVEVLERAPARPEGNDRSSKLRTPPTSCQPITQKGTP